MENYYDELKQTIIKMIQSNVDIPVLDSPIEKSVTNKQFKFPILLFKSYYRNQKNKINVIDFEKYDKYSRVEIPKIKQPIEGMYILCNSQRYKIVAYNNGILELETDINNLSEYNDMLIIDGIDEGIVDKDFILVTSPYNYNNTMNYNTVENFRRFQIDLFLYHDLNEDKNTYYTKKIHKIFERDFQILNKDNIKIRGQFAYIQQQLSFDLVEYNLSNKIVRGSMLIRTYNR